MSVTTPLKTILLDLGNVVALFSHERMCSQMGDVFGVSGETMRAYLFDHPHLKDFETGRISETEFHRQMEQDFGQRVDFDALRLACADIFELNRPIVPIILQLRTLGYRIVLLSNTCVSHFEFLLERYEVLEKFDDYVLSYEVGSCKPEPAIYEAAKDAILCDPFECIYFDDIAENVEGALRAGLHARLFTNVTGMRRDLAEMGITLENGLHVR